MRSGVTGDCGAPRRPAGDAAAPVALPAGPSSIFVGVAAVATDALLGILLAASGDDLTSGDFTRRGLYKQEEAMSHTYYTM